MQSPRGWVAGSVCALMASGVALGGTISFTDSTPLHATSWSDTLAVPQFDASLGTLTAVAVTVESEFTGAFRLENTAASAASAYAEIDLDFTLTGPDGGVLVDTNVYDSLDVALAAFDGVLDYAGASGVTGNFAESVFETMAIPSADFALYTGVGTVAFPAEALGHFFHRISSSGDFDSMVAAITSVSVDYTFEVPEPAAWLMLAVGPFWYWRRR